MSDKSFVTMEQNACVVCTRAFDTGAILLDRRMRDTFERSTVTAWGMCPECTKFKEDGFVQLVESRRTMPGDACKPDDADRTGRICRIKKEAFERVFNTEAPPKGVAIIEPGVIEALQAMVKDEPEVKEQVT